jgi:hypothetical protein
MSKKEVPGIRLGKAIHRFRNFFYFLNLFSLLIILRRSGLSRHSGGNKIPVF